MNRYKCVKYDPNKTGKDFIVGDIHGCFSALEMELKKIRFNKDTDRLFSTGDLIDRGPESHRAIEFLKYPWFFPVYGNHEDMFMRCRVDMTEPVEWHIQNGGEWANQFTGKNFIDELAELIRKLPLAIQVGDFGIVHSRIPEDMTWEDAMQNLSGIEYTILWDRTQIPQNTGVKIIFAGHTINHTPVRYGDILDIDTGAFTKHWGRNGYLTIMEIK
jgi:serine/threonine protein phosphatase 1